MRNLRLKLMYNGAAYHGWQRQNNAVTVQGVLENVVERIFCEHITIYGCSRTDAGVHANEYFCNFKTERTISCADTVRAVNAYLPFDIVVLDCDEMPLDFNSRFDCRSKEYVYRIWNNQKRNPFLADTAYYYKYRLDEKLLNEAAKDYIGTYDWSAFCASGSSVISNVRTVKNASVMRDGDMVSFTVEADGFLYNMVRIMAGTLININEGKIEASLLKDIILSGDRKSAGVTAPGTGLFLNKVNYGSW